MIRKDVVLEHLCVLAFPCQKWQLMIYTCILISKAKEIHELKAHFKINSICPTNLNIDPHYDLVPTLTRSNLNKHMFKSLVLPKVLICPSLSVLL